MLECQFLLRIQKLSYGVGYIYKCHVIWSELHYPVLNCGRLKSPVGGTVILTGTTVGSRAYYSCEENYELKGVGVRVCEDTELWSGEEPVCEREYIRWCVCFCDRFTCQLSNHSLVSRPTQAICRGFGRVGLGTRLK